MRTISSTIFYITVLAFLYACNDSYKNSSILSDKEIKLLEEIQGRYLAKNIKAEQADTFNTMIPNSISITIWNSKNTGLKDSDLNEQCEGILKQFIEAYQPENKYDFIKINFAEGTDMKVYRNWKSAGRNYDKDYIKNITDELNSTEHRFMQLDNTEENDSIISFANTLIAKKQDLNIAYVYQALAYYRMHDTTKSIASFKMARSFDSANIEIPMNLAIAIGSRNQYSEALKYIDTVLIMQSEHPKAIYYRGLFCFYNGNKGKACEDMLKAEKLGVLQATAFLKFNCK